MPRPLRNTDPKYFRHVSIRTQNAQLLLVPSKMVNELVGGIIAKYQEQFGIEIYAYTVTSNHPHLLVRDPNQNLWMFMQSVDREMAKRVNWLRRRRCHLWERRREEQQILTEEDLLKAFRYVSCNVIFPAGATFVQTAVRTRKFTYEAVIQ